jgi:hypothetical protein
LRTQHELSHYEPQAQESGPPGRTKAATWPLGWFAYSEVRTTSPSVQDPPLASYSSAEASASRTLDGAARAGQALSGRLEDFSHEASHRSVLACRCAGRRRVHRNCHGQIVPRDHHAAGSDVCRGHRHRHWIELLRRGSLQGRHLPRRPPLGLGLVVHRRSRRQDGVGPEGRRPSRPTLRRGRFHWSGLRVRRAHGRRRGRTAAGPGTREHHQRRDRCWRGSVVHRFGAAAPVSRPDLVPTGRSAPRQPWWSAARPPTCRALSI